MKCNLQIERQLLLFCTLHYKLQLIVLKLKILDFVLLPKLGLFLIY